MATHSSVLALRIPGTGEPGGLLSMGSHRVRAGLKQLSSSSVYMSVSISQLILLPLFPLAVHTSVSSASVSVFLLRKQVHLYHFSRYVC